MTEPKHKLAFELHFGEGQLERVQNALDEAPCRYSHFANVMQLFAEGFSTGYFDAKDGRIAALFELLACGAFSLAESEGEELGGLGTQIRMMKRSENYCYVNPEIEAAS